MKFKKISSMILAVLMVVSCLVGNASAAANPFTDVKSGAWYAENVQYVYENGLMYGTTDTTFAPNATMTRAMLVTVLYRMDGSKTVTGQTPFTDIRTDAYYYKALLWAYQHGIIAGTSDFTFSPSESLSREMMVAIFYRYARYAGLDISPRSDLNGFKDRDRISNYAKTPFQWAVQTGLIYGEEADRIGPKSTATRAQCAAILQRFSQWAVDHPAAEEPLDHVTLKIWFHGSIVDTEAETTKQVIDAVNEYLGEKINVTLSPIWGTWGDFDTNVTTALAGGDDCDIYFTSNWSENEYNNYSRMGYYVRLDQPGDNLLEKYAPELLKTIPQSIWDLAKTDGADGFGVYAVPGLKDTATQYAWNVNATLLTELGYNINNLKTNGIDYYSDAFEEMLAKAKAAKGADFYPLVFDPMTLEHMVNLTSIIKDNNYYCSDLLSYYFDSQDPSKDIGSTIVNKFGTDRFRKFAERTYELAQKGYISPGNQNIGTLSEYWMYARDEGMYLFRSDAYGYGYVNSDPSEQEIEVAYIPCHTPYMDCTSAQGAMMAVSAVSKNKERAVMFLNLLNTDSKLMTMLNYGLAGVQYTNNSDGTITFNEEIRDTYTPWRNGMGNIRLLPPTEWEGTGYWDRCTAFYNTAKTLPYGAFIFDSSDVKAELEALSNVYDTYGFNLMVGAVDPATELPIFLRHLEDAGIQDVLDAANAQLTAYMAKK